MTQSELNQLQPGPEADAACAVARGWKMFDAVTLSIDQAGPGFVFDYRNGNTVTFIRREKGVIEFKPSRDANDARELLMEVWDGDFVVMPSKNKGEWNTIRISRDDGNFVGEAVFTGSLAMACVAAFLLAKGAVQP